MWTGRDADRPRRADIQVCLLELSAVVEDLNAPVAAIAHVHVTLCIGGESMRRIELPRLGASRPPGFDEHAVFIELRDPRVTVAVRNENVPGGIPSHVGRAIKHVGLSASAHRSTRPTTRTAAPAAPASAPAA